MTTAITFVEAMEKAKAAYESSKKDAGATFTYQTTLSVIGYLFGESVTDHLRQLAQ